MRGAPSRRHVRFLTAAIVASALLHALAFAVLPGMRAEVLSAPRILEVALRQLDVREPHGIASVEALREAREPKRRTAATRAEVESRAAPLAPPIITVSEPRAMDPPIAPPPSLANTRTAAGGASPSALARDGGTGADVAPQTLPDFSAAYLRNPPPRYPPAARRNGEEGRVTLKVLVSRDGAPASVAVEQTSGSSRLDGAALETVKTWRFVPARKGSEPIEAWVLVPIVFRLEDAS